jgi:CTP:molybdopterin cytidylyltransferase MocA
VLPAIILAAGESTRMGRPKALLETRDGRPFVAAVVRAFAAAAVTEVVIVTGRDHAGITDAIARDAPPVAPRLIRNPDPSRGQLSSLWVGMEAALARPADGLLVTLVDVPLLSPAVIARVVEAWRTSRAPVVRPAIGGRHGHPVVFDAAVFEELRRAPLDAGAKSVVRAHAAEVLDVPVADEGCLIDVDTPAEYEQLMRR